MKVLILSPTYFHKKSFIGGAERYVDEFALSLSKQVPTTLVSFGTAREIIRFEKLTKLNYSVWWYLRGSHLNPFNLIALKEIRGMDVIYVHGVCTMMSDLVCLFGRLLGKQVYVMDHGGGGEVVLNRRFPVFRFYTGGIAQSDFAGELLPRAMRSKITVIKGGVDLNRFQRNGIQREKKRILFVGRLLAHKGVDQLIRACQLFPHSDWRLVILGNPYDLPYEKELRKLAEGYPVEFIQGAEDRRLMEEYQKASVLVLPSTKKDCYGQIANAPELMGFVLMEAQACGIPVICTDVGATSEFVKEGETGYVVPQNQPEAIHGALEKVFEQWEKEGERFGERCRDWVKQFSWETVVNKHLQLFQHD